MSTKAIFIVCAQALLAHMAFTQCVRPAPAAGISSCGTLGGSGLAYGGIGNGYSATIEISPTSGSSLPVSSASANPPNGISIASEVAYEGTVSVAGELPFLSAVALEGVLPSAGSGVVNYSCGNGATAITSEYGSPAAAIGIGSAGIGAGAIGCGSGVAAIPSAAVGLGRAAGGACGCGRY